jgi:hypothetical protein
MISAVPLVGRFVAGVVSVMVDPVGASSGTRWQATVMAPTKANRVRKSRTRVIILTLTIILP